MELQTSTKKINEKCSISSLLERQTQNKKNAPGQRNPSKEYREGHRRRQKVHSKKLTYSLLTYSVRLLRNTRNFFSGT